MVKVKNVLLFISIFLFLFILFNKKKEGMENSDMKKYNVIFGGTGRNVAPDIEGVL